MLLSCFPAFAGVPASACIPVVFSSHLKCLLLLVALKCPCFCTCILAISVFKTFAIGPAVAGVAKLRLTSLLLLVLAAGVPTIEWRPFCSCCCEQLCCFWRSFCSYFCLRRPKVPADTGVSTEVMPGINNQAQ
jgi:hypothetical protein